MPISSLTGRSHLDWTVSKDPRALEQPKPKGPDTNGTLQAASSSSPDKDGGESTLIERIREIGFNAYAEEIKEEKLAKMREEILRAMGLTEEDLQKMPPEQRDAIEKMIAMEIAQRLSAQKEVEEEEKRARGLMPGIATSLISTQGGSQSGLGILIALQERNAPDGAQHQNLAQNKDDEDGSR